MKYKVHVRKSNVKSVQQGNRYDDLLMIAFDVCLLRFLVIYSIKVHLLYWRDGTPLLLTVWSWWKRRGWGEHGHWFGLVICVPFIAMTLMIRRQHLCSATSSHHLILPPHRWITYGGRAFTVTGPLTQWHSLPKHLHDPFSVFGRLLKIVLFSEC